MAGPMGAAISAVSQMGEGATAGSDSGAVRGLGQLVFNPARNIDALSDKNLGTGAKIAGLLLPGAQEMFRGKKDGLPGIQREDPRQTEALMELERIGKNIQAGTDAATQGAIGAAQEGVSQTQSRLSRVTGGNAGATVDAFLKAQRAGQSAANQAVAQGASRLPVFMNMAQQLRNRVAQRRLELDLLDRAQFSAEKAQADKEADINKQGAIGTAISTGAFDSIGDKVSGGIQSGAGNVLDRLRFGENAGVTPGDIVPAGTTTTSPDVIAPMSGGTEVMGATGTSFF